MRFLLSTGEMGRVLFIGFICAIVLGGLFFFTDLLQNIIGFFIFTLLIVAVVLIVIERFSGWT